VRRISGSLLADRSASAVEAPAEGLSTGGSLPMSFESPVFRFLLLYDRLLLCLFADYLM
jgi:hypothetical protein